MSDLDEAALQESLKRAMKNRDAVEVSILRGVIAAVKNARIERRLPPDAGLGAAEIVQIVRRELKQREEAISFAEQGRRADLVEKNQTERDLLQRLLPAGVSTEDVAAAIARLYDSGANTIGALMAKLKEEFGARLDSRSASGQVKDFLQSKGGA